jgi:hypothetical protein
VLQHGKLSVIIGKDAAMDDITALILEDHYGTPVIGAAGSRESVQCVRETPVSPAVAQ